MQKDNDGSCHNSGILCVSVLLFWPAGLLFSTQRKWWATSLGVSSFLRVHQCLNAWMEPSVPVHGWMSVFMENDIFLHIVCVCVCQCESVCVYAQACLIGMLGYSCSWQVFRIFLCGWLKTPQLQANTVVCEMSVDTQLQVRCKEFAICASV